MSYGKSGCEALVLSGSLFDLMDFSGHVRGGDVGLYLPGQAVIHPATPLFPLHQLGLLEDRHVFRYGRGCQLQQFDDLAHTHFLVTQCQ